LTFSGQLVASFPLAVTGKKTKPLTTITGLAAATMKYYLLSISDQLPSQLSQVSSMCTVCNRILFKTAITREYVIGPNFHPFSACHTKRKNKIALFLIGSAFFWGDTHSNDSQQKEFEWRC
jgi:hypothetical protein